MHHDKSIKHRRIFLIKIITAACYQKLRGDEAKMMSLIADGFLSLGGVYVKFLQGVLLQVPLMKLWKSKYRFDVYENVPADPLNIGLFLKNNLSPTQLKEIVNISEEPFASGSFGQVYRAKLLNGDDAVIKVLRPNTRKLLKSDLRVIGFISRLIASMLTNWNVDLRTMVKEFIKTTLKETDYKSEAKFAVKMYKYYLNNKTIVIPKTYEELCGKDFIVQEYLGGVSLAQLLRENQGKETDYGRVVFDKTGSILGDQLVQLGVELNLAVLKSGVIHGDPHPGNIRLLPDNKVGLLDFGVETKPLKHPNSYYAVLKEFWKAEYLNEPDPGNMFVSYIHFYAEKLYDSLKLVSEYMSRKNGKSVRIEDWISQFCNKIFKAKVTPEQLFNGLDKIRKGEGANDISVDKIVNPGNRFNIGVRISDGSILRTLANYLSLVTELGYRSIVPYVYNEVVEYVEANMPELKIESPSTVGLNEAIEIVYFWLEKVARSDRVLYGQLMNYVNGMG
jgi:serine/threonine protein kinase